MQNNSTIRLFTGTYADARIFQYIYDDIRRDFERASYGKWVEPENLHCTYHFIGDFPVARLNALKSGLNGITVVHNSHISFRGIDVFPNINKPRVLHIPVIDDGILGAVHSQIGAVLRQFKIKSPAKTFKPHLTIQRIKDSNKIEFRNALLRYKNYDFGIMNEFEVCLIESRLTTKGPVYRIL